MSLQRDNKYNGKIVKLPKEKKYRKTKIAITLGAITLFLANWKACSCVHDLLEDLEPKKLSLIMDDFGIGESDLEFDVQNVIKGFNNEKENQDDKKEDTSKEKENQDSNTTNGIPTNDTTSINNNGSSNRENNRDNNSTNNSKKSSNGSSKPNKSNNDSKKPSKPNNNSTKPTKPNNDSNKPNKPNNDSNKPNKPSDDPNKPDKPVKPEEPKDPNRHPENPDYNDDKGINHGDMIQFNDEEELNTMSKMDMGFASLDTQVKNDGAYVLKLKYYR